MSVDEPLRYIPYCSLLKSKNELVLPEIVLQRHYRFNYKFMDWNRGQYGDSLRFGLT